MKVDLTPAEMKALVHALNMRIAVFNERLQEVGGRAESSWRLIRNYVRDDDALRSKLRGFLAENDEMQRKLRAIGATKTPPVRD